MCIRDRAYMAPMIGGIYYTYRRDALKGALFTAFILALEIQANHPQITYYALICLMIFGIVEFVYSLKNNSVIKFLKTSALLIIPFVIAVGINFASLYTTYEYGKYSIRGKSDLTAENNNTTSGLNKDYITTWSYGVDETFNLLIPNYKGGSSRPFDRNSETFKALSQNNNQAAANQIQKYWGTQPGTDGPHYVGAIVFFLFVLGLILIKGSEKWWLLAATVLSIMLAWGKNFMLFTNLFIEYFPGYNKFRAVTMTLIIAEFCIPLLGFLALRDIFNGTTSKREIVKSLKIAAGITGGFILLIIIIPGMAGSFLGQNENDLPEWLKSTLITDRKDLLRSDAFRSLVFIVLSSGAILGFIFEKLRKEYAILIIALLIIFGLWTVDKRYLDADRFERPAAIQKTFTPSVADAFILKDASQYRVLNLGASPFNDNSPTSYFHKSIGGYHGAKMERYQELIDSCIYPELGIFSEAAKKAQSVEELQMSLNNTPVPALNMLNARYVIYNSSAPPLINPNALGNAWFVEKPVIVENANKEISSVKSFNPSKEATIDNVFKDQIMKSLYPVHIISEIKYRWQVHFCLSCYVQVIFSLSLTGNLSQNSMVHHAVCPLCSSEKIGLQFSCTDHFVSRKDFAVFKCSSCDFLFTQDYPEEIDIAQYYESDNYISHSDTSAGISNKLYRIARSIMLGKKKNLIINATGLKKGTILDIGSGTGYFAATMKKAGWMAKGIEINAV